MSQFDVAIVGGGPAGLAAALTLSRSLRTAAVFDAAQAPRNAASPGIGSLLGHDRVAPDTLRRDARADIEAYGLTSFLEGEIASIEGTVADGFLVRDTDGQTVETDAVLLACGMVDRLPEVEGFERFWGNSVINCPFCHGIELHGLPWAVVVNRPEMLAVAEIYRTWCDDLLLLVEPGIDLPASRQAELLGKGIGIEQRRVRALVGEGDRLRTLVLEDGDTIERGALVWWPFQEQTPLVRGLGLDLDEAGCVVVDEGFRSAREGVYAAGDLVYAGHQNVPTALHMGNLAAAAIVLDLAKRRIGR